MHPQSTLSLTPQYRIILEGYPRVNYILSANVMDYDLR